MFRKKQPEKGKTDAEAGTYPRKNRRKVSTVYEDNE